MSLKDFLRDTMNLGKDDVYKVDTKDSFSFFNTEAEHTEQILQFFTDFKLEGRFINVEVSKSPGGGGGRGRKDRGRKKGRDNDRGGRRKRRERSSSKGNSTHSGKRRSKQSRNDFF